MFARRRWPRTAWRSIFKPLTTSAAPPRRRAAAPPRRRDPNPRADKMNDQKNTPNSAPAPPRRRHVRLRHRRRRQDRATGRYADSCPKADGRRPARRESRRPGPDGLPPVAPRVTQPILHPHLIDAMDSADVLQIAGVLVDLLLPTIRASPATARTPAPGTRPRPAFAASSLLPPR